MGALVSPTSFYQRALALGHTVTHLDKNRGSYSASLAENPDGAQSVVHRCAHILLGRRSARRSEFLRRVTGVWDLFRNPEAWGRRRG